MTHQWKWVSEVKIKCPICGKPDYCSIASESGLVICRRVASDRPTKGTTMPGWIHSLNRDEIPKPLPPPKPKPTLNAQEMRRRLELWGRYSEAAELRKFADSLGVSVESLDILGCVRGEGSWAFPMRNAEGFLVGIRTRRDDGEKRAVPGSRQGLFFSPEALADFAEQDTLFIAEGPTDTAAFFTMGLYAIGRPSCTGCDEEIVSALTKLRFRRAVLAVDNDRKPDGRAPGLEGCRRLQEKLPVPSMLWFPPKKDVRAFLNAGGSQKMLFAMLKNQTWKTPEK